MDAFTLRNMAGQAGLSVCVLDADWVEDVRMLSVLQEQIHFHFPLQKLKFVLCLPCFLAHLEGQQGSGRKVGIFIQEFIPDGCLVDL